MKLLNYFSNDLAVDIGTANTLVYLKGRGIVANEPSVVAVKFGASGKRQIITVGKEAKNMVGRTPGTIKAIMPMKEGVIADFDIAHKMLEYFIRKTNDRKKIVRPRIIVSVPIGITEVEKRALQESAEAAGAREVFLIEEAMSAAIGAGLPVTEPVGSMIVDIGGGTTSIAVISLAGIVVSTSVKSGGYKFDDAIMQYIKSNYNILIGERTAEEVKIKLGSELAKRDYMVMKVKGRDLRSGKPSVVEINAEEVWEAMSDPIIQITEAIRQTLERTPPELSADIVDKGIMITGGGALLSGLDNIIRKSTSLTVNIADDPLTCVVIGSGKALSQLDTLREVSVW